MSDGSVGRLLVASLHQGIADVLPTRLEFYEAWLHPSGLRDGRIGLAPLAAVLSFLRLEGRPYALVAERAGEYAAEWTVANMAPTHLAIVRRLPESLRLRVVARIAQRVVRNTYVDSRAAVRWRRGKGAVVLRGSVFCEVREPVAGPLCHFYAAAIGRLMSLFKLDANVSVEQCRASGAGHCTMAVLLGTLAMLLLLVCSPASAQSASAPASPRYLVVPFENATRDVRAQWLGEGSAIALTEDLLALGATAITRDNRLRAFDRLRVPQVSTLSHATIIRLGQIVGATHIVIGSFETGGDRVTVRARSIRLDVGRLASEIVEQGPLSEFFATSARVARRLVPDSSVTPQQMADGHAPLPAFESYVRGLIAEAPSAKIALLGQALARFPSLARARVALWDVLTDEDDHKGALATVKEVPSDSRFFRRARFLAGVSLLRLAQYPDAFATFLALNREQPDPALLNNLGVVLLRRPQASAGERAATYLAEATRLEAADPDLFFNLGYAYWIEGDIPAAIQWLREAVRRNPADGAAHYVLGVALQTSGVVTEARREKELAKQLSSVYAEWEAKQSGANRVPRGLERVKTEIDVPIALRVDSAIVAAGQRDQRELASFHLAAGRRAFLAERDTEAVAELRRAVYLAPYDSQAHLLLGRAYLRLRRPGDAISSLRISIWSEDTNGARLVLADAYLQVDDVAAARVELQRIVATDPNNREAQQRLAELP